VEVLSGIPRIDGNPWVIPGKAEDKPMQNLRTSWRSICNRADIDDMRYTTAAIPSPQGRWRWGRACRRSGSCSATARWRPRPDTRIWRRIRCGRRRSGFRTVLRPMRSGDIGQTIVVKAGMGNCVRYGDGNPDSDCFAVGSTVRAVEAIARPVTRRHRR